MLLVAATETSLPTLIYIGKSTFLAMVDPYTLIIPTVLTPSTVLKWSILLIRSLVSPD